MNFQFASMMTPEEVDAAQLACIDVLHDDVRRGKLNPARWIDATRAQVMAQRYFLTDGDDLEFKVVDVHVIKRTDKNVILRWQARNTDATKIPDKMLCCRLNPKKYNHLIHLYPNWSKHTL